MLEDRLEIATLKSNRQQTLDSLMLYQRGEPGHMKSQTWMANQKDRG
jgi:hypothetical protein